MIYKGEEKSLSFAKAFVGRIHLKSDHLLKNSRIAGKILYKSAEKSLRFENDIFRSIHQR